MKQVLLLMLAATVAFSSCSKKDDDPNPQETNTVEIGGATYETVQIGTQTWTTINYNGPGGANYEDGANDPKVGKLYYWDEARGVQLPNGWRLPTKADFDKLLVGLGATQSASGFTTLNKANSLKLMGITTWPITPGTNETKFNALAAGTYNVGSLEYWGKGESAAFWSSTPVAESNGMFVWSMGIWQEMDGNTEFIEAGADHSRPNDKLSLRFVKDN